MCPARIPPIIYENEEVEIRELSTRDQNLKKKNSFKSLEVNFGRQVLVLEMLEFLKKTI